MDYRRVFVKGGCYFFTVVTHQRQHVFTDETRIALLRNAFQTIKHKHPFQIDAIVIMPNHLHCVWTLPTKDASYSRRWRLIKTLVSKEIHNLDGSHIGRTIWQRRFWEHLIRDQQDFESHIDYIHYNPVKHGYVDRPVDWRWSSFHRYVRRGILDENWGAVDPVFPDGTGRE